MFFCNFLPGLFLYTKTLEKSKNLKPKNLKTEKQFLKALIFQPWPRASQKNVG